MSSSDNDTSLTPFLSSTHCSSDQFPVFTKLSKNLARFPSPTLHCFRRLLSIDSGFFFNDLKSSRLNTHPLKSLGSLLVSHNTTQYHHPNSPAVTLNPTRGPLLLHELLALGLLSAMLKRLETYNLLSIGLRLSLYASNTASAFCHPKALLLQPVFVLWQYQAPLVDPKCLWQNVYKQSIYSPQFLFTRTLLYSRHLTCRQICFFLHT